MRWCPDCRVEHLGLVPCGYSSPVDRMRSVQVHGSVRTTMSKRRYWDDDAVNAQLGGTPSERRERLLDDTQGLGYAKPGPDGRWYHRNRKTKEVEPLDAKQAEAYLGPTVEE